MLGDWIYFKIHLWKIVNDIDDIGAALYKNGKNNVIFKMEKQGALFFDYFDDFAWLLKLRHKFSQYSKSSFR